MAKMKPGPERKQPVKLQTPSWGKLPGKAQPRDRSSGAKRTQVDAKRNGL